MAAGSLQRWQVGNWSCEGTIWGGRCTPGLVYNPAQHQGCGWDAPVPDGMDACQQEHTDNSIMLLRAMPSA